MSFWRLGRKAIGSWALLGAGLGKSRQVDDDDDDDDDDDEDASSSMHSSVSEHV